MKSHATDLQLLLPLLFVLLITGCVAGPKIMIETDEPADDFVVVCNWFTNLSLHGTGSSTGKDVRVVKSGEVVDCGRSLISRGYVSIMHPVYVLRDINPKEKEDGVEVIRPITRLRRLDENKTKFESGYWNDFRKPGSRYLSSFMGCGLGAEYLNNYNKVKKVDSEYFRSKYNASILECLRREYQAIEKYDLDASKQLPSVDERIKLLWAKESWKKYE